VADQDPVINTIYALQSCNFINRPSTILVI